MLGLIRAPAIPALLGFGLIPGPRELVLVVIVALLFYGRNGSRLLLATPYGRRFAPWINLAQRAMPRVDPKPQNTKTSGPRSRPGRRPLWWWLLTGTLAAAALAWVATRIVIHQAARSH